MNTNQCFITLESKSVSRYGNDCIITSNIVLLQFSSKHYVVLSSEQALGGWTNNDINTSQWSFKNIEEAFSKYRKLERTLG